MQVSQVEMSAVSTNEVDTLGALLAQIAELTKQADAIKDGIKDAASMGGDKVVEGALFKATYMESNRSTVDHKALYAALGITAEQVAQYTKTTAVFTVKVTSR
jgi:hypothetical protein